MRFRSFDLIIWSRQTNSLACTTAVCEPLITLFVPIRLCVSPVRSYAPSPPASNSFVDVANAMATKFKSALTRADIIFIVAAEMPTIALGLRGISTSQSGHYQ